MKNNFMMAAALLYMAPALSNVHGIEANDSTRYPTRHKKISQSAKDAAAEIEALTNSETFVDDVEKILIKHLSCAQTLEIFKGLLLQVKKTNNDLEPSNQTKIDDEDSREAS
jgi:hypothetical protein